MSEFAARVTRNGSCPWWLLFLAQSKDFLSSVVVITAGAQNHRGTENIEVAQRNTS